MAGRARPGLPATSLPAADYHQPYRIPACAIMPDSRDGSVCWYTGRWIWANLAGSLILRLYRDGWWIVESVMFVIWTHIRANYLIIRPIFASSYHGTVHF